MKTVFKYPVPGGFVFSGAGDKTIQIHGQDVLPVIRHFGVDPSGTLCIWAEVDDKEPPVSRRIHIVGTGHEVPGNARYIASCVDRAYVWHLYADVINPGG